MKKLGNPQSRIPDVGKRKFIKKGFLAVLAGVGAAILAKTPFAKATGYLNNFTFKGYEEEVNALGDLGGGTDDIDLTKGKVITATVSTSAETFTFSNPPASGICSSFTLILTDGGSQTVNWPASVSWMTSEAPTLVISGVDVLSFQTTDGGTTWYGWVEGSTALVGDIGLLMGGFGDVTINYIRITTLGDATDFGDLTQGSYYNMALGSSTRGVSGGGNAILSSPNVIEYVTFANVGNAIDFGDLLSKWTKAAAISNETRGIFAAGTSGDTDPAYSNVIQYITIATTGNSTNFGDTTVASQYAGGCGSPTRGVFSAGATDGPTLTNIIEYVTIATTGNSTNFGDLTAVNVGAMALSSSTRGVFICGFDGGSRSNILQYVTIASTGDATDFGDSAYDEDAVHAMSNKIRGVWVGYAANKSMSYITIASASNGTDFGDTTVRLNSGSGCSNCHGGL